MNTAIIRVMAALFLAWAVQSTRAFATCAGDCGGDGEVTVDELVLGVNIALGSALLNQCGNFDSNNDGDVTIDELIAAVGSALNGCSPVVATATATATSQILPTATPGIVPPGISTQMLGIWSGHAKNDSTGVDKAARIKIAVTGGVVVVTDLNANVFATGSSITVTIGTPTAVFSTKTVGSFPGGFIETFQLALAPNGLLGGTYATTTLNFPPVINALALVLTKES